MKSLEAIAAEIAGYDPQALRADAVGAFLERLVEPVREAETVALRDALDRILADDVISPLSVPPHDNSAMDGYAFDGAALRPEAALTLRVVGTALAGKAWQGTVGPGDAGAQPRFAMGRVHVTLDCRAAHACAAPPC